MTARPAGRQAAVGERQVRLLYAALVTGTLVALVGAYVVRALGVFGGLPEPVALLRWLALGLLAAELPVILFIRGRIEPLRAGGDAPAWWRTQGFRGVLLWVLGEGIGLIGAVFYLLTGDLVTILVPGTGAVLVLLLLSPNRLAGR